MGRKISDKCKNYLKWANFTLGQDIPRYRKRLWADVFLVLAYTVISATTIWIEEADMIVLLLNILCLSRALIGSTINASEATKVICKIGIEEKHEGHSHYHIKSYIMSVAFAYTVLLFGILLVESSNGITKSLATISILIVCCNDIDNIVICAYDASI